MKATAFAVKPFTLKVGRIRTGAKRLHATERTMRFFDYAMSALLRAVASLLF